MRGFPKGMTAHDKHVREQGDWNAVEHDILQPTDYIQSPKN